MATHTATAVVNVALIGNPNTGKSTLFTALAGVRQKTGNYPGVTVEKKVGRMTHGGRRFDLVDLPGTYSLAPRSPDEMVAVDVLLGREPGMAQPQAVLCILDASNLERNLYLASQVLELGLPTVIALNMTDVAEEKGIAIDAVRLAERLGVPVVPVQAHRRRGIAELQAALAEAVGRPGPPSPNPFPDAFREEVTRLEGLLGDARPDGGTPLPRYLIERLLLDSSGFLASRLADAGGAQLAGKLTDARQRLAEAGCPVPAVEAMARYGWIGKQLEGLVTRPRERKRTATDRIDRVLTHKVWGTLVFALVMLAVYTSLFIVAATPMGWIESAFAALGGLVEARMAEGALRSLLVDGVIGGVGGVLVFLPQIMFLFLFIAILEDCGYMARAAYLMDKLMVRVGLSGKSFIPLLSSFACAIPGVMAARVIEDRRDRLTTIMVAPLMSCSARLPVYAVLIAAFIPAWTWGYGLLGLQGLTMFAMYSVGILVAAGVALLLKKTLLRGPTPPFVLELPSYKWPSPTLVVRRMLEQGWSFVRRAGTLILAVSIVVWALLYYPHDAAVVEAPFRAEQAELAAQLANPPADADQAAKLEGRQEELDRRIAGAYQRQSFLGRMGRFVEPVVKPLGWDWRIGCAAIASFPAREVVVATLGVIFNEGADVTEGEGATRLGSALQAATWDGSDPPRQLLNVPVALSIMVFFALCAQCAATLAVIKRETNSWGWPLFSFVYMTVLAWLGAFVTYQVGMLFV